MNAFTRALQGRCAPSIHHPLGLLRSLLFTAPYSDKPFRTPLTIPCIGCRATLSVTSTSILAMLKFRVAHSSVPNGKAMYRVVGKFVNTDKFFSSHFFAPVREGRCVMWA